MTKKRKFGSKTFTKVKTKWDAKRRLPKSGPAWHLTKTEWNAISAALGIAIKATAK